MVKNIIALLHLPPPSYGVSFLNQKICQSSLSAVFRFHVVAINTAETLSELGNFKLKKPLMVLKKCFHLYRKLISGDFAAAYFSISPTGMGFYKDVSFVVLLKFFRIPIVYHLHSLGIKNHCRWYETNLYRFCFRNEKVILLADSLYSDVAEYVNRRDVYILNNGISERSVAAENRRNQKNEPVKLLFLANMLASKGVFDVLKAIQILLERHCPVQCCFVGEWGDISESIFWEKVDSCGIRKHVRYLGFLSGMKKDKIFQDSDIFVYPTRNDAFPLVLLEAMQFGLPVVSTDRGAIPEIVDNNRSGFLVPGKDPQAIADKTEILIRSPELRRSMGAAGREKFLLKYTWQTFEKNLLGILNDVTGSSAEIPPGN